MPFYYSPNVPNTIAILIKAAHGVATSAELTWLRRQLKRRYQVEYGFQESCLQKRGLRSVPLPTRAEVEGDCAEALSKILSFVKVLTGHTPPMPLQTPEHWLNDFLAPEYAEPIFLFCKLQMEFLVVQRFNYLRPYVP